MEQGESVAPARAQSYESVLRGYTETLAIGAAPGARDLIQAELAAPLAQPAFLSACGAPDDMKITVRVAVRSGRALGVTVIADPPNRAMASCIDRAVRGLRWPFNPKTDFVTTSY